MPVSLPDLYRELSMKLIAPFVLGLLFAANAQAGDIPVIWTGYGGNAGHTGFVAVQTDPTKFKELWTRHSSSLDWPHQLTTTDHFLYTAFNILNAGTAIAAIDPLTGKNVWYTYFDKTDDINGVIAAKGKILVTVVKGLDSNTRTATIVALDAESGKGLYTIPTNGHSFSATQMPVIVGNEMYVIDDMNLVSIDIEAGLQNWSLPAGRGAGGRTVTPTASMTQVYLTAADGKVDIVNRKDKTMVSLNATERDTQSYERFYDASSKTLYVRSHAISKHNDILTAYNADKLTVKWRRADHRIVHVAAANTMLYYTSGTEDNDNETNALYELEAATGKITWLWRVPAEHAKCTLIEDLMVTNDMVFITMADWYHSEGMRTLAFTRKSHELVWQINKVGHLSADNHRLFLESHDSITAIAIN